MRAAAGEGLPDEGEGALLAGVAVLTWSLAAAGINDFLQAGFAALGSKTNELQERVG